MKRPFYTIDSNCKNMYEVVKSNVDYYVWVRTIEISSIVRSGMSTVRFDIANEIEAIVEGLL